jgi:hypothetical protein
MNNINAHPVSPQTVRNVLKQHSFKAVTKKKKPLLTAVHGKRLWIGLWRTGRE